MLCVNIKITRESVIGEQQVEIAFFLALQREESCE
jgi:hypothetical protein